MQKQCKNGRFAKISFFHKRCRKLYFPYISYYFYCNRNERYVKIYVIKISGIESLQTADFHGNRATRAAVFKAAKSAAKTARYNGGGEDRIEKQN